MKPVLLSIILSLGIISFKPVKSERNYNWDISPFGKLSFWSEKTGVFGSALGKSNSFQVPQTSVSEWNIGLRWNEERDIDHLEIVYENLPSEALLKGAKVQYWFQTWPGPAPREHTIEDPMDDPWQGKWLTAATSFRQEGKRAVYAFEPMTVNENKQAANLPEPATYRRTLKVRMLYNSQPPAIQSFKAISPTRGKKVSLQIDFGCDKAIDQDIEGKLEIYNGKIEHISGRYWTAGDRLRGMNGWKIKLGKQSKGIAADLLSADPTLGGSNDLTVVTVRSGQGNFSFLVKDLEKGPVYIPAYSAYIHYTSDTARFSEAKIRKGQTIREKINTQPEQSYERATREIPPLSVMLREDGGKLYLPLAADASWQKFGFEWGGGFFMNKRSTKAKGKELARCNWSGNELHWDIGTGKDPVYIRDDKSSHMSVLNDYLPVAQVSWNHEGLIFREEAFATLLKGPLSPYDNQRSEQTPAVLMVKLNVSNPSAEQKTAHIWLKTGGADNFIFKDMFILDKKEGNEYIRLKIKIPGGVSDIRMKGNEFEMPFIMPANQSKDIYFTIPFPGDLTGESKEEIASLVYDDQLNSVVKYWRDIVSEFTPFEVPEHKFGDMSRSVIPHIRMSTTKDPKTGLFMVPAASFGYQVYANESAFQTIFLDRIGDHRTAESYLETFLQLQGTIPMPGTFTGNQQAVFHGGKISDEYNYTSGPYNLDHGTVLWALGLHYLMTKDNLWLKHAHDKMLVAADWIIEQRSKTKIIEAGNEIPLHYGLLPAGRLEDNADWGFWFAVNAYGYLGLKTTAEAFRVAGMPEAERLEKEAAAYLSDLRNSVIRSSELCPVVRMGDNTYAPYVPSRVYQRFRYFGPMQSGYYSRYGQNTSLTYRLSATREALYGPLILITTGILDPDDPLSEAILNDWEDNITLSSSLGQHIHGIVDDEYWFSRGGMVFQPNLQNPIQAYLLRKEIPAAIRSVYNSMVSCFYPDVSAFTEEYRRWGVGSGPMYKIPDESRFVNRVCDMLVLESGKELWLAPGTPRYWLEPGKSIRANSISTVFGKVSFEIKNTSAPNTIKADIVVPSSPEKVKLYLRSPFGRPVKSVLLNGKSYTDFNQAEEYILLPKGIEKAEIIANY